MEFIKMCQYVDDRLNLLSLEQRITIFHDILNCPVKYTFCKYYYQDQEWDEFKMKDFLAINQHWLTVRDYDKLYHYFSDVSEK